MSQKQVNKFKRMARRQRKKLADQSDKIKVQALQDFFEFSKGQKLRNRLAFCFKILFKKL